MNLVNTTLKLMNEVGAPVSAKATKVLMGSPSFFTKSTNCMRVLLKILHRGIFKDHVFRRAQRINQKQTERLKRVQKVYIEINRWDDIPLTWRFNSLCQILCIKPDKAAMRLLTEMCIPGVNLEKIAKRIPLDD